MLWHDATVFIVTLSLALLQSLRYIEAKPKLCTLPHAKDGYSDPEVWRCHGQLPLWTYDSESNDCIVFYYGGCGGNDNSFFTHEDCKTTCATASFST